MDDAPHQDPLEAELIAMITSWNAGERSSVAEPIRSSRPLGAIYDAAAEVPVVVPSRPERVSSRRYQPKARPAVAYANHKSIPLVYYRLLLATFIALGVWALAGDSLGPHHRLPDMVAAIAMFWVTATALRLADLLAEHRRSFGMCLILRLVAMTTALFCMVFLLEAVYSQ